MTRRLLVLLTATMGAAACGDELLCGDDPACFSAGSDARIAADAGAAVLDASEHLDANDDSPDSTTASADVGASDAGLAEDVGLTEDTGLPLDPGPPTYPQTINLLNVALRTGYGVFDGTDTNRLSVCLTETDCFPLNIADVDDFRRGEIDAYSWEDIQLRRDQVDRVEIRSAGGTDAWRPACLQIMFDGEPMYCNDNLRMQFGNDAGELASWRDPLGIHLACDTCYLQKLTHGPMVGAVTASTASVWLRTDATRRVSVHVIDQTAGTLRPVEWLYPAPQTDFTATVEIDRLSADTTYLIEVDGQIMPGVHTIQPAPDLGAPGQTKIAFGSCSKNDDQSIFEHIRFYDPDLFLFAGDNHYANSGDRDSLRWYYQWGLTRGGRAELAADTPTLATWDDHDYTGNNTDGTSAGKDTALRVFKEYWANPSAGTAATQGVFFQHRWGDIDLFFVDDRYWRGFDQSLLGAAQTRWLLDALEAATGTFKLIVCGSQWTAAGSRDSWASFLPARDVIFDHIRDQNIPGVVLLSGDVHRSELRLIDRRAAGSYDLPEIVSSPLANSNSPCRPSDELRACFDAENYFVTLDVDTATTSPQLTATIVDEHGRSRASWTILRSDLEN